MSTKVVILSCDGGGIRGLASAVILAELERRLREKKPEKKLHEYFEGGVIAGTSTGSIIACGISSGITAEKIQQLYQEEAINIFPEADVAIPSLLARISIGFSQPIYQDDYEDGKRGINNVLKKRLGDDLKFGSLKIPTLITSYDTLNQQFIAFKSNSDEFRDIKVWEIARASSAAPVAFPAYLLNNKIFVQSWKHKERKIITDQSRGECIPLIDGGLSANNPTMCAVIERLSWAGDDKTDIENIVVISLGTGIDPTSDSERSYRQLTSKDAQGWGLFEWVSPRRDIPILRAVSDGSADVIDTQIESLLGKKNYFRFQPKFSESYQGFNANKGKLNKMVQDSMSYLNTPDVNQMLGDLVDILLDE